jgi:hypothetical protein
VPEVVEVVVPTEVPPAVDLAPDATAATIRGGCRRHRGQPEGDSERGAEGFHLVSLRVNDTLRLSHDQVPHRHWRVTLPLLGVTAGILLCYRSHFSTAVGVWSIFCQ